LSSGYTTTGKLELQRLGHVHISRKNSWKILGKFQLSPLGRKRRNVQAEYCVIKGTVAREGKTSMVVYWKEQKRKRRKRTAHSFNNTPPLSFNF
jgi:hypothetical protein